MDRIYIVPHLHAIYTLPTLPTVVASIALSVCAYTVGRLERLTDELGVSRHRQQRRERAEAKRLRIVARNLKRSEWPQFKALSEARRDQAGRQVVARVRYAGRGRR